MENRNPYASPGDSTESQAHERKSTQWTLVGSSIPLCWLAAYGWLKIVLTFIEGSTTAGPAAWTAIDTWIVVPWLPSLLILSVAISCVFNIQWAEGFPKWLVAVMFLLPFAAVVLIAISAICALRQA